jgi:hypothetical protein
LFIAMIFASCCRVGGHRSEQTSLRWSAGHEPASTGRGDKSQPGLHRQLMALFRQIIF